FTLGEGAWRVFGWTTGVSVPDPIPPDLLELAGECDEKMPKPSWSVDQSGAMLESDLIPAISFEWLEEPCGELQPIVLTSPCATAVCDIAVTRNGCRFELAANDCVSFVDFKKPVITGRQRRIGDLCVSSEDCVQLGQTLHCTNADHL